MAFAPDLTWAWRPFHRTSSHQRTFPMYRLTGPNARLARLAVVDPFNELLVDARILRARGFSGRDAADVLDLLVADESRRAGRPALARDVDGSFDRRLGSGGVLDLDPDDLLTVVEVAAKRKRR